MANFQNNLTRNCHFKKHLTDFPTFRKEVIDVLTVQDVEALSNARFLNYQRATGRRNKLINTKIRWDLLAMTLSLPRF